MTFGFLHVGDMLKQMSATELQGWWSYYQVEPWGAQRDDGRVMYHAGLIGSLLGSDIKSACAVPDFVADIYGPP